MAKEVGSCRCCGIRSVTAIWPDSEPTGSKPLLAAVQCGHANVKSFVDDEISEFEKEGSHGMRKETLEMRISQRENAGTRLKRPSN